MRSLIAFLGLASGFMVCGVLASWFGVFYVSTSNVVMSSIGALACTIVTLFGMCVLALQGYNAATAKVMSSVLRSE